MSSGSKLPPLSHHHSASYTYGASETQSTFSSGLSQERSTASPTPGIGLGSSQHQSYTWPPKAASPNAPFR
ncbi:uncharacterized protein I303_104188 [Kwoniella dejecticola CBS 10117]|uniref:Uncharacterized protein n=1 Tax=Kwoniella dejecticola CBS 10117 TaxID=1296121 RepID=A0AAJ8KP05_9TREE